VRIKAALFTFLFAISATFAVTGTASAAAQKFPLVGPFANIACSNLTPSEEDVEQQAPGFAIFNANKNKVSAVVSLKDAPANTEFPIRLIQGTAGDEGGADCYTVDGILKTNAQGKGTLNVSEPPTGTRVQVIIDTSAIFGTPTFRATEFYVFAE
jgi:hypothetical protein